MWPQGGSSEPMASSGYETTIASVVIDLRDGETSQEVSYPDCVLSLLRQNRSVLKRYTNSSWVDFPRIEQVIKRVGHDRAQINASFPTAIHAVDGVKVAVELPIAPNEFSRSASSPLTKAGLQRLDELLGAPPSSKSLVVNDRIALLHRLAQTIDAIHRCGIVLGDLSGGNILWSVDPVPSVYLIGVDSAVPMGAVLLDKLEISDGWDPMTTVQRFTPEYDAVLLAMTAVRLLSGDRSIGLDPGSVHLPENQRLESEVRRLVQEAANGCPPSAAEWMSSLADEVVGRGRDCAVEVAVDRLLMQGKWQQALDLDGRHSVGNPRLAIAREHLSAMHLAGQADMAVSTDA